MSGNTSENSNMPMPMPIKNNNSMITKDGIKISGYVLPWWLLFIIVLILVYFYEPNILGGSYSSSSNFRPTSSLPTVPTSFKSLTREIVHTPEGIRSLYQNL
jgi:tellurite resistance protein TehA-like permease